MRIQGGDAMGGHKATTLPGVLKRGANDSEDELTEWDRRLDGRAADEQDEFFWHFDMLCDRDRNAFFDQSLQFTIGRLRERSASVHVLDIGTGSGLLALLANRHGADAITAIERVQKLVEIAARNFKKQGVAVCLLSGSSRDLSHWPTQASNDDTGVSSCTTVTGSQLHSSKPNVVVAELFETGLLGEGVLPTLRHAAAHLLAPGFAAIPAATTVYARLVRGSALRHSEIVPDAPQSGVRGCSGAAAPWHVHADAMRQQGLIAYVSDVFEVLHFDWGGYLPGPEGRSVTKHVMLSSAGSVDGILMYWTCTMGMAEREFQAEMSTAPGDTYRRDHWRQAIFTRCSSSPSVRQALAEGLVAGTRLEVTAHHDDHEIWFDSTLVAADQHSEAKQSISQSTTPLSATNALSAGSSWPQRSPADRPRPPLCTCGMHTTLSRHACWARNDVVRQKRLQQVGCKPNDADFGSGLLEQLRWIHHISSQVAHITAQQVRVCLPSRVEVYAQAIHCPSLTKQFESTNGQSPFRRSQDDYVAQVAEMDLLRTTRLGVVAPRTVALWEFPHDLVSAVLNVGCIQRDELIRTSQSVLTLGRLDLGAGSSNADAVAFWCDLVYGQLPAADENLTVLPGGSAGGPHQMCDVVPIAWADHEMAESCAEAPDERGLVSVRVRLDWGNNWAQCAAKTQPDPGYRFHAVGPESTVASGFIGRHKAPRHR